MWNFLLIFPTDNLLSPHSAQGLSYHFIVVLAVDLKIKLERNLYSIKLKCFANYLVILIHAFKCSYWAPAVSVGNREKGMSFLPFRGFQSSGDRHVN